MEYIKFEGLDRHEKQLSIIVEILKYTGGYVAGGCFKNLFNKERPRDIDVYFETEAEFNSADTFLANNTSFKSLYKNDNVTAYIFEYKGVKYAVELVKKFFLKPNELLDKFDFSICKFAVYSKKVDDEFFGTQTIYCEMYDKDFFEHLFLKKLVVDDSLPLPYSTFTRMIKYIRYGYLPCMETKQKIVNGIRTNSGELTDTSFYDGMD